MSTKSLRRRSIALCVVFTCSSLALGACKKAEELANKAAGKEVDEDADKEEGGDKADGGEAEGGGGGDEVEPEAIPHAPMHSGLDLMLSFVPDEKAQFFIARDASVLKEYWDEGLRFVDSPADRLAKAEGSPDDFKQAPMFLAMGKGQGQKVMDALTGGGLKLQEGAALVKTEKGWVAVFNADSPDAFTKIAASFGESAEGTSCQALADHEGWNVCADAQATLDAYKPAEDPSAVRAMVAEQLKGVDLDEANLLAYFKEDTPGPVTIAITTLPGLIHLAAAGPFDADPESAKMFGSLEAGDQKMLASVQPGAGFMWGRTKDHVITDFAAKEADAPPEVKKVLDAITGEFVLAGSVDPGGLVMHAGLSDSSVFTPLLEKVLQETKGKTKEIPELKGSKLTIDKVSIEHSGTTADALHIGATGIPQADALRAFTGIHLDGWAFASGDALTIAAGTDPSHIGKMMVAEGTGPGAATLASLPQPLAKGLEAKTVSFVMHLPVDFLQGAHFHKIVKAALKDVPDVKPEVVLAATSVLSPLSSASLWFEQPSGSSPVIHMALQGIGNRATKEGKAALDAAHAITEGKEPEAAFKPLADTYKSSAMAFAYTTRAGTDGPGSLVGSGVGAALVAGAVGYTMFVGKGEDMAAELGVDPTAPDPELAPHVTPVAPTHTEEAEKPDAEKPEEKKPDEKKPEEKKPDAEKPEEKKPDEKKPEPKGDKSKPKPKPEPKGDAKGKKKGKGGKKKGKKKKKKR